MMLNKVSISLAKYEVSKFDGGTSFSQWKIKMWSFLVFQGLWKSVEEKISGDSEEPKIKLSKKSLERYFCECD